ncbi:MAG: phosphodiester glycosidase family protein [Bacillota bacterium]|nr:phosphodiester glycosidase family protein [Bacillota bacterium]
MFFKKLTAFFKGVLIFFIAMIITLIISLAALFYGPYHGFRDVWVTTAMTTLSHKYLATWFFPQSTIDKILADNKVEDISEKMKMLLFRENHSKKMELIDISRNGFKGWLLKVPDPSKIKLAVSKDLGKNGEDIVSMAQRGGYAAAINAGGFADPNGKGNGGHPYGLVIQDSNYLCAKKGFSYNIIGFNKEDQLVIDKLTYDDVRAYGIRDAVSFGPTLIKNGKAAIIKGNGGWGIAPRTAIGQTADGTVLMLVIDGRQASSIGASLKDVMNIMQEYGAVNAANLDGGSSTTMYYQGKVINSPCFKTGLRPVATAFVVKP